MLPNSFRPVTGTSRVLPVRVERRRIVSLRLGQTMARCEPSGDKLQLHRGSLCGGTTTLALPHIEPECFHGLVFDDAVQAKGEGQGQVRTLHVEDADVLEDQARSSVAAYGDGENGG
jgi:hypothetical protein